MKKQWNQLMTALGVKAGDVDSQLARALGTVKKLKTVKLSDDSDEEDDELDDEDEDDEDDDFEDDSLEDDDEPIVRGKKRGKKREPVALSHSPFLVRELAKSRTARIDALLLGEEPLITPAMAKKLKTRFCSKEAIKSDLALSEGDGETEFDRQLALVKDVAGDKPLARSGRREAPPALVRLSHDDGDEDSQDNVLLRNAKRRAKRAELKRKQA